tara:strand:- start:40 stop:324 length:285 start_codon:yes stop_codon:yes gene_type:complete
MNIAFNNLQHSDALSFFINQKSHHISKLLWKGERMDWVVEQDAKEFKPVLKLKLKGKNISISAKAKNAFSAVNEVVDKAKRLVLRNHKRLDKLH